jgi:hypothetical protein
MFLDSLSSHLIITLGEVVRVVSVVTVLLAGRSGVRITVGARESSPNCPHRNWVKPVSYSLRTGVLFQGLKRPGPEVDLHLAAGLRMSGALHIFPLYVFMARPGTTPHF